MRAFDNSSGSSSEWKERGGRYATVGLYAIDIDALHSHEARLSITIQEYARRAAASSSRTDFRPACRCQAAQNPVGARITSAQRSDSRPA